jgi:hypothetical protein
MKQEPVIRIKEKQMQLNLPVTFESSFWMKESPPLPSQPTPSPIPTSSKIRGKGDAPRCTTEQVRYYRENQERILPPEVIRSVKRHRDVLHGGRSLNMLLPKQYHRPTKDFDIYSKQPKQRADDIENYIDKRCGCDMAYVKYKHIPNVSGIDDELMSADIHQVTTITNGNGDVDYMTLPPRLPITCYRGIRHERLTEALRKAKRGLSQPLRMAKATKDVRRITAYLESKGRKLE